MIGNVAFSIGATDAWAGITTFIINTGFEFGTVVVGDTLGSALDIRITKVLG